jgi:uncharacterized protein (TIGR02147 family)
MSGLRELLQGELARRCADNPRYSLRAFARFLRVDHATLSSILRGKRRLTEPTIRRLATRLGAARAEVDELVRVERTNALRIGPELDAGAVRQLANDAIESIATWHDFAILELTRLQAFVPDARWIARVLGCTVDEVQLAIHRLTRLGFLEMTTRTRWVDKTGDGDAVVETPAELGQLAALRLADQLRELAVRAARTPSQSRFVQSATTIAIDRAVVPHAIARLEAMRAELVELLTKGAGERRNAVYHLVIGFVPVTQGEETWDVPS